MLEKQEEGDIHSVVLECICEVVNLKPVLKQELDAQSEFAVHNKNFDDFLGVEVLLVCFQKLNNVVVGKQKS